MTTEVVFMEYNDYICFMVNYYLEVLKEGLSICLDPYIGYYHHFVPGDIITVRSHFAGPKVVIDSIEYNCEFTIDWNKIASTRLTVTGCIYKGYLVDITNGVHREEKLKSLGI